MGMDNTTETAEGVGAYKTPHRVFKGTGLPRGWEMVSSMAACSWIPLPRPRERDPYSSLSRSTLLELLNRGFIEGVSIRRPGAQRGKRLILKISLENYLMSLLTERTGEQLPRGGGSAA
jgi:hypothetical protein